MDDGERRLLSALARRFYLEDASKTDLAEEFSMSRFRVARLLQQAREQGVVTIVVHDREEYRDGLAADLARHLMLDECVVVRAVGDEDENRRQLARAAAAQLKQQVRENDAVGFSWGRTLVAIGEELADLPSCTLIQLTGTVGNDLTQSPVEVIRRIADRSNVETVAVFSPLFAASEEAARALRDDPAIASVIKLYDALDIAVLSLGSWSPPITQLAPIMTAADRDELTRAGARAEIAGIFVRDDGSLVDAAVAQRRISVSVDQLLSTPRVLAVAGSVDKVPAIAAVARSGLLTCLITDDRAATALRRLPAVERRVLSRPSAV